MKVQFIYTFDNMPQVITEYTDLYKAFIESKNVFLSYAISGLNTDKEKQNLIKISCCILTNSIKIKLPDWYNEMHGKFLVDYIEIWKHENGIKSSVSKEYIRQFELENN